MELIGKISIITGAGRGIGAKIAEYLSGKGSAVVIADMDHNAAQDRCLELEEKGKDRTSGESRYFE